jgi:Terminase small subunit
MWHADQPQQTHNVPPGVHLIGGQNSAPYLRQLAREPGLRRPAGAGRPAAAYLRAGYTPNAHGHTARLAANGSIKRALADLRPAKADKLQVKAEGVLARWLAITSADPNELIEVRRICCRGQMRAWKSAKRLGTSAPDTSAADHADCRCSGLPTGRVSKAYQCAGQAAESAAGRMYRNVQVKAAMQAALAKVEQRLAATIETQGPRCWSWHVFRVFHKPIARGPRTCERSGPSDDNASRMIASRRTRTPCPFLVKARPARTLQQPARKPWPIPWPVKRKSTPTWPG